MVQAQKQPTSNEFIDFSLYDGDRLGHPVYKWLLAQPSYNKALRSLKYKGHCQRAAGQGADDCPPG